MLTHAPLLFLFLSHGFHSDTFLSFWIFFAFVLWVIRFGLFEFFFSLLWVTNIIYLNLMLLNFHCQKIPFLCKHNFVIDEKYTQWNLNTKVKAFHESISFSMKCLWNCISWNALKEKFHSVSLSILNMLIPFLLIAMRSCDHDATVKKIPWKSKKFWYNWKDDLILINFSRKTRINFDATGIYTVSKFVWGKNHKTKIIDLYSTNYYCAFWISFIKNGLFLCVLKRILPQNYIFNSRF